MFSASPSFVLQPRATQLCRVLLRVRLFMSVIAVALLAIAAPDLRWGFVVAFVFAVVSSALAYVFWRPIMRVLQRHPILLAVDTFLSLFILTGSGRAAPFLIFTMVTSAIAGLLYRWGGLLYVTGLQVVCYVIAAAAQEGARELLANQTLLVPAAYYIVVGFTGLWIRRVLDEADRAEASRHAAELAATQERERTRLARDMHDSLAKTVRGIAFAATALPSWISTDEDRATEEARRIATAAEVAAREARDLMTDLRTGRIDRPLVDALRDVTDEWAERTGVACSVDLTDVELPVGPRHELVSVLKEALTNVERHAHASTVMVRLGAEEDGIRLQVADDGAGFDTDESDALVAAGHYGLVGMRERARRAGGDLTVVAAPGDGCVLTVVLPHVRDDVEEDATTEVDEAAELGGADSGITVEAR